jgi:RNA polymerase sigma-70 factor (ECF subfamily)
MSDFGIECVSIDKQRCLSLNSRRHNVKEDAVFPTLRFSRFRTGPYQSCAAFSQLYDRAHVLIFRYIFGLTGGPAQEVEDLTAETFFRAWRTRGQFDGEEAAAIGWLIQIARRLVIDRHRRQQTRPVEDDLEDFIVAAPDAAPEEQTLVREQSRILWKLLQDLPNDQREMLVMRHLLGWRVNQIAEHFNMNENTVSVTLRRTLERLRRVWPQA